MIAIVQSATVAGVEGVPVSVEVHISNGLPSFNIVGLPDAACREARDRVRAALLSAGLPWPQRRVTVNLAPSGVKKVGTAFDLPIAVGLLVTAEVLPRNVVEEFAFVGELGLDGSIRSVNAAVPLVAALECPNVVVPRANVGHASLVPEKRVFSSHLLADLVSALRGDAVFDSPVVDWDINEPQDIGDMSDVRGQPVARWALEIAAAGGHNLLLTGPPGSGKTMLAQRLVSLLPDLDSEISLAATRIHSALGLLRATSGPIVRPPLRAPHHSASLVSLIGGGSSTVRPGEVSASHGGVLFLDEMGEFARSTLDSLRQPLEEGVVRVSRAAGSVTFPADFQLVGASNPCPCGRYAGPGTCECTDQALMRYRARLSGPLLDRFDMRVVVGRPEVAAFVDGSAEECSADIAHRVRLARMRCSSLRDVRCNASLRNDKLDTFAPLTPSAKSLIRHRLEKGLVTGRGVNRVRRVALTIADLRGDDPPLTEDHLMLAFELHVLGREEVAA